jgi:hypothetical protein
MISFSWQPYPGTAELSYHFTWSIKVRRLLTFDKKG